MTRGRIDPAEKERAGQEAAELRRQELEAAGTYVSPLMEEDPSQMSRLLAAAEIFAEDMTDESKDLIDDAMRREQEEWMNAALGTPKPRGLHAKIAEIAAIAERIPKNGRAAREMGGYPFVQVGDAADWLRPALAERSMTMLPVSVEQVGDMERLGREGRMVTQTVKQVWQITDAETGEFIRVESFGTGGDTGDKFSPKAQTNAMKYAILMTFMLSTGDDPEAAPAPTEDPAPITVTSSKVEGVKVGGRQTVATKVQIDAIRNRVRALEWTPEQFVALIGATLAGNTPDLTDKESVGDQQRAILDHLATLSFEDAAKVVAALEAVPVG